MWYVFTKRTTVVTPFSFSDLQKFQEDTFQGMKLKHASALIFAEVDPVITLGNRQTEIPREQERLSELHKSVAPSGMKIEKGDRGGLETWHGPGQWIGYVVAPLEKFSGDPKGVRKSVHLILELVLQLVKEFVPEAKIKEGDALGIWSDTGKLASIGIRVKEGYITGGFSLNCYPTEYAFFGINPCGLAQAIPDFLFNHGVKPEAWKEGYAELPARLKKIFENKNIV
jgi:lipoate-protein ligase B